MRTNITYINDQPEVSINIPEKSMYASIVTEVLKDENDKPTITNPNGTMTLDIVFSERGQKDTEHRALMYNLYRALIDKDHIDNFTIAADNGEEIFNLQSFNLKISKVRIVDTALMTSQTEEVINKRQNISILVTLDWQV